MSALTLVRMIREHALLSGTGIAFLLGIAFQFLPSYWQFIVLAGLVPSLLFKGWLRAFTAGFLGVLLSWMVYVAYLWTVFPAPRLISTLGDVVGIPGIVLVALAMLVGSLFGGLGAVMGVALQRILRKH